MKVGTLGTIAGFLLFAASALTGCSNDLRLEENSGLLEVSGVKLGTSGFTRGLKLDGEQIIPFWSADEEVEVKTISGEVVGTMTPQTYGTSQTKLRAQLTKDVAVGDQLQLWYPRSERDYTGQTGSLDDIALKYDYAEASVTVDSYSGSVFHATNAQFHNRQAIVRFQLYQSDGSPFYTTHLSIAADGLMSNGTATGRLEVTPPSPTNDLYVALSGISNKTVSLTVGDETASDTYSYTTASTKTFADGHFYTVNVKFAKVFNAYSEPLTLEATVNQTTITISYAEMLEYSTDKITWTDWPISGSVVLAEPGNKLYLRGSRNTISSISQNMKIACENLCYVYGNVMSLLSKEGFARLTTLPYDNTFAELFKDNDNITHVSGKDLVLPATTLRKECYFQMFSGCSNLNHIRCLATDLSAQNCTFEWLKDVADQGTFVKAKGSSWSSGESGIPEGWTTLEE